VLVTTASGRPWEADRSGEARLAILDALLSADVAIVTSTAHDIVTNRDLGIPVVIEELADALPVLRSAIDGGRGEGAVVIRHHRRLADDETYDPAGPAWAAALRAAGARGPLVAEPGPDAAALGFADLTAPYRRPHDLFLREGLNAALPPSVQERDEEVDLTIGNLQDSILAHRLLAHLGDNGAFADWITATKASESLPPLRLGDRALHRLVRDVAELIDVGLGHGKWPEGDDELPTRLAAVEEGYAVERVPVNRSVQFDGTPVRIEAELEVIGDSILRIHHGELRGHHLVEAWVAVALLTIERPATSWTARIAGYRTATSDGQKVREPVVRTVALLPDAAETVIEHVLHLRALARSMPIPLFPRATTALALGSVGDRGASGWKFPKAIPTALGKPFDDFKAPFTYDLERGATAWFFGDATADSLSLVAPNDVERDALDDEATQDSCAALAYARHLYLAFTRTATIAKSLGGGS